MFTKMRSNKGFTLIELLIVVAIIGILAAIAIPQFSKYRIQGFNASGNSDLKNIRTSQESLFTEWSHYGRSEGILNVAALPGTGGFGASIGGPITSTVALPLIIITTNDNAGTPRGLQIPVGNNVSIEALTPAAGAGDGSSFNLAAKHLQGDTTYACDSDSTTNYKLTYNATGPVGTPPGQVLPAASANSAITPAVSNVDQYQGVANWVKM